ncbi:hypothetical protein [Microbacterium sp. RG1]|uniref:hypothetical protein n=1 Tax=Microbacterium sp. RG1 TaxID=2489212 RepID=UPI0010CA4EDE|nr:hypothetical protein [Microbacterium sp. RG1]QCQ15260.1 hypothetical protein EHF32_00100 [Microbacterium sp. RG1]
MGIEWGRINPVVVITAGVLACMLVPSAVFIAVSAYLAGDPLLGAVAVVGAGGIVIAAVAAFVCAAAVFRRRAAVGEG